MMFSLLVATAFSEPYFEIEVFSVFYVTPGLLSDMKVYVNLL